MANTQDLLDEIKKLQAASDAAGLKGLEDHADKKVRKAARKAIHVLRSKGVEIPEQARSWNDGGTQSMRRHAGPIAMLDMSVSPGVTRLTLSLPNEDQGAALFMAILDPSDRVLDFAAYYQTDGQQARTGRDWLRDANGRSVSATWAAQRILWARASTHASNIALPRALDEALPRLTEFLGESAQVEARPEPTFIDEGVAEVEPAASDLGQILMSGNVHSWPLLFDGNELFDTLGKKMEGVEQTEVSEADRLAHIMEASQGDEALRTGLSGPLANAVDDVATVLFLDGSLAEARRLRQMTSEMRSSDAPESVDGVVNLIQLQLTSAALQQLRQQGGMGGLGGGHDHDHDHHHHDHDHDHDH